MVGKFYDCNAMLPSTVYSRQRPREERPRAPRVAGRTASGKSKPGLLREADPRQRGQTPCSQGKPVIYSLLLLFVESFISILVHEIFMLHHFWSRPEIIAKIGLKQKRSGFQQAVNH